MLSRQRLETIILRRLLQPIFLPQQQVHDPARPRIIAWPARLARRYKLIAGILVSAALMAAARHELKTSSAPVSFVFLVRVRRVLRFRSGSKSGNCIPGNRSVRPDPWVYQHSAIRGPPDVGRLPDQRTGSSLPAIVKLLKWGIHPPYDGAGKRRIEDSRGGWTAVLSAGFRQRRFRTFEEIPSDRCQVAPVHRKPGTRICRESDGESGYRMGSPGLGGNPLRGKKGRPAGACRGGSTLAVQLEKYRHSPKGRTDSASDKLRQILGAS